MLVGHVHILSGLEVLKGEVGAVLIFKHQVKGSTIGDDRRVKVLGEWQQVFTVSSKSCVTPLTIVELDAIVEEVQGHAKSFCDWSSKQHWCLSFQEERLDQSKLVVHEDGQVHCPRANCLVITSKVEVSVGLLEGDLVHREVELLEVVQVSAKRTIAHQERGGTRIHHRAIWPLSSRLVLEHHHAALRVEDVVRSNSFSGLSLVGTSWSSLLSWLGSLGALRCRMAC